MGFFKTGRWALFHTPERCLLYSAFFANRCCRPTRTELHTEANFIDRAFTKLIADNHLPKVVFHSLRHTSTTYKLKLSGGDIKAVQGDTGHAQATMVTERYAHILDDDRRVNATRFQKEFYGGGEPEAAAGEASEVQRASTDPLQDLDAAAKQQLLLKLLAESPDIATLLTALTGRGA